MIVDPPRCGLHNNIITACRKCSAITELIYVSCNPTGSFVDNTCSSLNYFWLIVNLCCQMSRRTPGSPFTALKSQPVDLFPSTEHCELMTLFAHMYGCLLSNCVSPHFPPTRKETETVSLSDLYDLSILIIRVQQLGSLVLITTISPKNRSKRVERMKPPVV